MKHYTWTLKVEFSVAPDWVADGVNPSTKAWQESMEGALESLVEYAYAGEVTAKVTVLKEPNMEQVAKEQGYPSAAKMKTENP